MISLLYTVKVRSFKKTVVSSLEECDVIGADGDFIGVDSDSIGGQ